MKNDSMQAWQSGEWDHINKSDIPRAALEELIAKCRARCAVERLETHEVLDMLDDLLATQEEGIDEKS